MLLLDTCFRSQFGCWYVGFQSRCEPVLCEVSLLTSSHVRIEHQTSETTRCKGVDEKEGTNYSKRFTDIHRLMLYIVKEDANAMLPSPSCNLVPNGVTEAADLLSRYPRWRSTPFRTTSLQLNSSSSSLAYCVWATRTEYV